MNYDLIIIGGGPAGMSAGIYAARKKIKTLILASNLGGQMLESYVVDNYLGISSIPGLELVQQYIAHLKKFEKGISGGAFEMEIKEGATVKNIKLAGDGFEVQTDKGIFESRSIILATGKTDRKLEIPGAKEFEGKGITYCATCDAPLFRDKIVAVIGAGDAGQDTAWQLTKYASKIYLLNRYNELRGDDKGLQEKLKKDQKVEILSETEPIKIIGDKFVTALQYRNFRSKEEKEVPVHGIFVEIGSTPASLFLGGLVRCNANGEIVVDHNSCATSVPGIYAAGDVTDVAEKQIIIAAGEGAKAALSAYNYLKNK
jgi:alkyl hydroperoxide reductase subunit F